MKNRMVWILGISLLGITFLGSNNVQRTYVYCEICQNKFGSIYYNCAAGDPYLGSDLAKSMTGASLQGWEYVDAYERFDRSINDRAFCYAIRKSK